MVLKKFLLWIILMFFAINSYTQNDPTSFNNLKLKSDEVELKSKKKIKSVNIIETYFFFTEESLFVFDEYGFLRYEFTSEVIRTEKKENNIISSIDLRVNAYDTKTNLKCEIKVLRLLETGAIILQIDYDDSSSTFYTQIVK